MHKVKVEYQAHHHESAVLKDAGIPDRMVNSVINRRAAEMAQQMTPGIRRFLREKIHSEQQLALSNGETHVDSARFIDGVMFDCYLEEVIRDLYENI